MDMVLQNNVEDIRAAIMFLENAPLRSEPFDQSAWLGIMAQMDDCTCRLLDVHRRMITARRNCLAVSVETEKTHDTTN